MIFLTETEVINLAGMTGFAAARQPDTNRLRVWEIAGTAHADSYLYKVSAIDSGTASPATLAAAYQRTDSVPGMPMKLSRPYNNGPQQHYILEAAITSLDEWIATRKQPPAGVPLELTDSVASGSAIDPLSTPMATSKAASDRLWMDVPTSRLSGVGMPGNASSMLGSSVEPFDEPKLDELYPQGKAEYLRKFEAALDSAINGGFILAVDKPEIMAIATAGYHGSR